MQVEILPGESRAITTIPERRIEKKAKGNRDKSIYENDFSVPDSIIRPSNCFDEIAKTGTPSFSNILTRQGLDRYCGPSTRHISLDRSGVNLRCNETQSSLLRLPQSLQESYNSAQAFNL